LVLRVYVQTSHCAAPQRAVDAGLLWSIDEEVSAMRNPRSTGHRLATVSAGLILCTAGAASGTEQTFVWPDKDAFVCSVHSDTNYGAANLLYAGECNGFDFHGRTLSYFDFDLSVIPANATVTFAELWLYMDQCGGAGSRTMRVHWVADPWQEGTITYDNAPILYHIPTASGSHSCTSFPGFVYWDVTTDVVNQHLGGESYALAITSDADLGEWERYRSKEHDTALHWPRIEISYELPPANDDCEDAAIIGDVQDLPFDTSYATFDGPGSCQTSRNVWYLYEAPCTGNISVTLCGSSYDTKLAVYDGASCDLTEDDMLACNDDGLCDDVFTLQSTVVVPMVEGQPYLIEVGGFFDNAGEGMLSISSSTGPHDFALSTQSLLDAWEGDAQWGDIDGDGDQDLVMSGRDPDDFLITYIYENQDGVLVYHQDLMGTRSTGSGSLAWGDYDGDGDIDLAMAGITMADGRVTRIYENDGAGNFAWDIAQTLTGVNSASLGWADYDEDGDLDLAVMGYDGAQRVTFVYRNHPQGTLSVDPGVILPGLNGGSLDWVDFDGDDDPDLVMTGHDGIARRIVFVVNDPPGTLTTDGDHGLPGVNLSDAAWGDYDNDGDLDLALTGELDTGGPRMARIYENDGTGAFTEVDDFMSIYRSSCAWADYDNDGDLDVVFGGYTGTGQLTVVYEYTGSGFDVAHNLAGRREGSLSWSDVTGDGRVDLLVTGYDGFTPHSELYEKSGGCDNLAPSPPTQLLCEYCGDLILTWIGGDDTSTPAEGLSYVLRVGTSPGADDVVSGTYGNLILGNVGQSTTVALDVPTGDYYWSVRSVDGGGMVSPWSVEAFCDYVVLREDVNDDGAVDVVDLVLVITNWGTSNPVVDITEDGIVDVQDLVAVILEWGPCP
jgi:hypothetical protein